MIHYADLFSVNLQEDNVQEFDARWDEIFMNCDQDRN